MRSGKLYFTEPFRLEVREVTLPRPEHDQILIQTEISAISAGTELLFYTGSQPPGMNLDDSLPALGGLSGYPVSYGYALAGRIIEAGPSVDPALVGRKAFAFHPHATHALVRLSDASILPENLDIEDSVFFPNMETAVNLVMDGAPVIGEQVVVIGLGVVGLLAGSLLATFPLASLNGIDTSDSRRRTARENGFVACHASAAEARLAGGPDGFDLVYELTGNPAALDAGIALCGFSSRLCVGSWYGTKTYPVSLGGDFHRNRITLFSSQVSTVAPAYTGRWSKARRAGTAWRQLAIQQPRRFITHRVPFSQCSTAYELIHKKPENLLQVVFTY